MWLGSRRQLLFETIKVGIAGRQFLSSTSVGATLSRGSETGGSISGKEGASLFKKMGPNCNGRSSSSGMNSDGERGALIVLEGCDKAGKSTQCKMLVESLEGKGHKCHMYSFPDRSTEIGKVIDQYLKCSKTFSDEAIHLLFSSNRWELMPTIRDILHKGESVILDRYAFSGVAFTAAKGSLSLEWCKAPDVGLPQPDAVFFLNLNEVVASARGDYGNERYEKSEFQKKVKDVFYKIEDPDYWKIVEANRPKEVVQEELLTHSLDVISSCRNKPISPLWSST